MIDTKELRRLTQAALVGPDGISLNWIKLLQNFQQKVSPAAVSELLDRLEATEKERDNLRAKIEAMGKQEPLDAGSDVFRSAFEAALKAGNWPATRQGDGYRSPSTQIAWRIAFSTVNRLKLYLSPGAQPKPDCGEAGHDEGRCGNRQCLPGAQTQGEGE